MPAVKLAEAIKSGQLSSEKVVRTYIHQAQLVDKTINAVVEGHYDEAIKRARDIDRALMARRDGRGLDKEKQGSPVSASTLEQPFVGVPFSVKESIAGASYTVGVATRANKRAIASNPAVDQLVKSGMIPLASTNTPCMNLWFDSYNLLHGRTNNPYDRSRIPGGSSGGEGALISAAGSVVGVGSDLAGSIRIPCHFCGIFGHKPTPGSISMDYSFPSCGGDRSMLRAIGPMARYACDLKPMLKLMITEPEARAKMRLDEYVDLNKIKIFFIEDLGDPLSSSCDKDILTAMNAAVQHLVSTFQVPASKITLDAFKYGLPFWAAVAHGGQHYAPEHPDGYTQFNPFVEFFKCILGTSIFPYSSIACGLIEMVGRGKPSNDRQMHMKRKAELLREEFNRILGPNGVLIMPTHPEAAPHHYLTLFKFLNCSYTAVANLLHAPITQCPLGMSREGLPIGVQLIATQYNDRLTLALAQELEKAFGGWQPPVKINYSGTIG